MEKHIRPESVSGSAVTEGVVVENRGAQFDVNVEGVTVRCLLRGKLKKGKQRQVSPVAAGDRVRVALLEPGRGVIEEVLPRTTDLSRTAAGSVPLQQTLAANVDQAVIVFAAAEPRCNLFLLERFLVMAEAGGLEQVICMNKSDLVTSELLADAFGLHQRLGFRVLFTSASRGDGIEELREALKDRWSAICGPSGVGKSSLLNAVAPGFSLRTGEMGFVTHKGRHTTTSIALRPLPFGGWIADMPGLRRVDFHEVGPEAIARTFPEIGPHLGAVSVRELCAPGGGGVRAAGGGGRGGDCGAAVAEFLADGRAVMAAPDLYHKGTKARREGGIL